MNVKFFFEFFNANLGKDMQLRTNSYWFMLSAFRVLTELCLIFNFAKFVKFDVSYLHSFCNFFEFHNLQV